MKRTVRFAPILLAVALSPAFLQTSVTCNNTGNTNLASLELEADALNRVVGFAAGTGEYKVWIGGATEVTLRALSADPSSTVRWHYGRDSGLLGIGGGETSLPALLGTDLFVTVEAPGGAARNYGLAIERDGEWGEQEHIGGASAGNALVARIAADSTGRAVAVWSEDEGGGYEAEAFKIWSSRYVLAVGWTRPEPTGAGQPLSQFEPSVSMSADGSAIAVWTEGQSLWASRYRPIDGWGLPALIVDGESIWEFEVASDPLGNAFVAWREYDGTRVNIWASRYAVGEGWGSPELIEDEDGSAGYVQVATSPDGDAIAVWSKDDGTRYDIWSNRYTIADGWGLAERIEAEDGNATGAKIGVDQNGCAIAVWGQFDGQWFTARANRYAPNDGWGVAEAIEAGPTHQLSYLELAVHSNGNAVAVWTSSGDIWANYFSPEVGWRLAERIEDTEGIARLAHVALDAWGNALAVWNQIRFEPVADTVWANRYLRGVGWGVPEIIAGTGATSTYQPRVVVDANGRGLVVWTDNQGGQAPATIWSNRFE